MHPKNLTLEIKSLAFGGEGIGRIDNTVVFVPNVIDGEKARISITDIKKNFLRAKLEEIIEISPSRVNPPCPYFTSCAGCQYQHIEYSHQLEIKKQQVEEVIKHIGKIENVNIQPVIPSPEIYNYRRLLEFHSADGITGFYGYDNKNLVEVKNCLLGKKEINELYQNLLENGKKLPSSFRLIIDSNGKIYSTFQDKKQILFYKVSDKIFAVPINSFFQTNLFLLNIFAEKIIEFVQPEKNGIIFDCFSGVGFFSIFLAEKISRVYGLEEGNETSQTAIHNAELNGLKNFISIQGKVEKNLPRLLREIVPDIIVLDPTRTGCHPDILKSISHFKIKKIIYISCNPSTLARDIRILCDFGYKLINIQPIDMFPQTKHIEVISLLELNK